MLLPRLEMDAKFFGDEVSDGRVARTSRKPDGLVSEEAVSPCTPLCVSWEREIVPVV